MRFRYSNRLRSPDERVGTLARTDLPPPDSAVHDPEWRLLHALRAGDETAFEWLFDRYHPAMVSVARRYVRGHEDAEEVAQDAWVAILGSLERFEGRSSLKTWIFRIVANLARTRAKREARHRPFSALAGSDSPEREDRGNDGTPVADLASGEASTRWSVQAWQPPDPAEEVVARELIEAIESAVGTMPLRQQEVFTLHDLEGWPPTDVCEQLDISTGNQRVLLHRARLKVREAIAPLLDDEMAVAGVA